MQARATIRQPLRPIAVWLVAGGLVVVAPWLWSGSLALNVLTQIGVAVLACLSFNLLLGQGGMLSFGHATYTGAGAYMAIHALNALAGTPWAIPVVLLPMIGGLAGMGLAALLGWMCTRRPGTVFAMITLGLGELVYALALMLPQVFGGEAGVSGNRASGPPMWGLSFGPSLQLYYLVAAYSLLSAAALYAFTFTPLGRLLNAARDNADRVDFIGYNPQWVRYLAFVIAGFFAGIAGALGALNFETVNPEAFSASKSGTVMLFTYLGGIATFYGPVLGGVLMVLCTVLLSGLTQAWLLYLGLLFMAIVVWVPGGLASWAQTGVLLVRSRQGLASLVLLVRLLPGAALLFAGGACTIEMLYHRQIGAALGPEMPLWGLTLNTTQPLTWLAAMASAATGGLWLFSQRTTFKVRWRNLMDACHAA